MRRFSFFLISICLLCSCPLAYGQEKFRSAPAKFGIVDFRMLLMAHPLMKKFIPEIRRFKDTASDFRPDKEARINELNEKIAAATQRLQTLEKLMKPTIQKGGEKARDTYSIYWKKRKFLENELDLLKTGLKETNIDGNYNSMFTSEQSLNHVIEIIVVFIHEIVEELRQKNGLIAILDVSCLEDPEDFLPSQPYSQLNKHWEIWTSNSVKSEDIRAWRKSLDRNFFSRLFPKFRNFPFRAGFKDLRGDSLKTLKEITTSLE